MSNVILIGYMGCGKTTVGKNLARICDLTFIDTDEQIEVQQGRTISEIFATDSEAGFRDMETKYLEELLASKEDGLVLSTGGGMAIRPQNQVLLKQIGTVVYLQAKPETIYERVKGDTKRPLLQCEDPLNKIKEMLVNREPSYLAAADHVLQVDDFKQSEIADKIKKLIS